MAADPEPDRARHDIGSPGDPRVDLYGGAARRRAARHRPGAAGARNGGLPRLMDWLGVVWFFGLFILLLAIGAPIAVGLGATGLFLIWKFSLGMAAIGPTFYSNLAKFQLLAIPFS